jgi:hypothetical protein
VWTISPGSAKATVDSTVGIDVGQLALCVLDRLTPQVANAGKRWLNLSQPRNFSHLENQDKVR